MRWVGCSAIWLVRFRHGSYYLGHSGISGFNVGDAGMVVHGGLVRVWLISTRVRQVLRATLDMFGYIRQTNPGKIALIREMSKLN